MNWLAHLLLAADAPPLRLVGNLAGDFVRGVDLDDLDPEIRLGIDDHRAIDRFTDEHRVVREVRSVVREPIGRYAEVAIDVWFDHVLARSWTEWRTEERLTAFEDRVGRALDLADTGGHLPPRLASLRPRIVGERWLSGYASRDGIGRALHGLSRRARRQPNPLEAAPRHLAAADADLERAFRAFFPELIEFARRRPDGDAAAGR